MVEVRDTGTDGGQQGPGGWMVEGVPARGARRVWARAVAGTLSAGGLVAASLSLGLVLAGPGGTAGATSAHAKTIKVSTAKVAGVGTVLTTASGLTLYRFTEDKPGTSTCSGACAKIWPPLLSSKGAHVSGPHGVKGLSLLNVGNGHFQVAFHKLPLYRFEGDKKKGQAHGQDVGKLWFAVLKSGIPATATAGAPAVTSPTAGGAPTTQPPVTSTTQGSSSNSGAGSGVTTPTQAPTPVTQAPTPVTQPPTPVTQPPASPTKPAPPTTTPTTSPTTTTTAPSGGGVGF